MKWNLSTIILNVLFALSFSKKFKGNLYFPFSKFTMNNRGFNSLILNLSCKDMFSNIKECAEQCFYRGKNGALCVAFLKYENTEECHICNPANVSELNSNNTYFNKNGVDLVYILKYKKKKPVMYLPLEGDNITGTSVKGDEVTGTLMLKGNTQVQAGKVNEGLHVKSGGRLVLDGTVNKCISKLTLCTKGLSIALWMKPSSLSYHGGHITHGDFSINIQAKPSGGMSVWTYGLPNSFLGFVTQSTVSVGHWSHVAVVFDPEAGMFVYMDGILDKFKSIDEASAISISHGSYDYTFGSKINGAHAFDGTLDEITIFYNSLASTDIWRENTNYKTSLKEEEIWDVTVENKDIVRVQTDSAFHKDEIGLITAEDGGCSNTGNRRGLFVYSHGVRNGCKFYRGHTSALWSGNQTLTSGGCFWWYIP